MTTLSVLKVRPLFLAFNEIGKAVSRSLCHGEGQRQRQDKKIYSKETNSKKEQDRHSQTERGTQKEEEMRDSTVPGGGRGGGGSE